MIQVEVIQADGRFGIGTAVSVAPGKFLTNCHVTRNAQAIVLVRGGVRWPVQSELSDVEEDLCVLNAPDLANMTPVRLGSARDLRVGQIVAAVGYTGGFGIQARPGSVGALHEYHGSKVIQASAAFSSGASGGGLFDEQGRLVGILTFRLPGRAEDYFSAPIDWIQSRIFQQSEYIDVAPLEGVPFWAGAPESLPYFLRAIALEAAGKWDEVLALTQDWARVETNNGDAWFDRGQALAHLDRETAAASAYQKAVYLDPLFIPAWLALGETYVHLDRKEDVRRVIETLDHLDPQTSRHLAGEAGLSAQ
ncbi:MAG: trypsin-like peptidase domain-containing protein [Burkholderiaceae bacterium]